VPGRHPERGTGVRAVTFDVWNTVYHLADLTDDHVDRVLGWSRARAPIVETEVTAAIAAATVRNLAAWWNGGRVGLPALVADLVGELPVRAGPAELADLVELLQRPLEARRLEPVEGADQALRQLHKQRIRLGIVSDTSWTIGRQLRQDLARDGWLGLFEPNALIFSDELGVMKPDPAGFRAALAALDVAPERAVHVGDVRRSDVAGARSAGMRTIRYTGCMDDPTDGPEGDLVLTALSDLPDALSELTDRPDRPGGC
jgi:putative hydrolase of the HAD superfamily